jgi:ABC-type amino acid transport substrate-binding protein
MKNITFLFILILLGCQQHNTKQNNYENSLEKIKNRKELNVGYINYPPIVYKNMQTGRVEGIFAKAIEEICNEIDVKVNYVEVTWANFTAGLQNKQFDLSIAPTFCTIQRAYSISFTTPLMYVGNSAVVKRNENRFKSLKDLDIKGITIAVTQGEQGYEYAQKNIKNAEIKVLSQNDQNLAFTQVQTGRADVALGDAFAVAKFVEEHKEFVIDLFKSNPYNLTGVSWAVRSDDISFLNFMNTSIDVLETTGKLKMFEIEYKASFLHKEYNWK